MKQRLVTGVLAGALFLGLMILGGHYYAALIIVMAIIAMFEFSRMNHLSWNNPLHIAALLGLLALVIPFESYGVSWIQDTAIIWLLMFVLLALTVLTKNKVTINEAALTFLGTVYLGIGFAAMIDVRLMEEYALWWSFIAFARFGRVISALIFSGVLLENESYGHLLVQTKPLKVQLAG